MKTKLNDSFFYRIKLGDTINGLSQKFNAEKTNILRNNYDIDLYVGEWVFIRQNNYFLHIVKPCETIECISSKYDVDINSIKSKNNLESNKLFIGQKIKIFK